MPRHIAQIDKRQPRVIARVAAARGGLDRWSASLSLLVITLLSACGWAVIGGLAYWTLH